MTQEYKAVNPSRRFINYKDHVEGDVLCEGFYDGATPGKFAGDNYLFSTLNGEYVSLNGCAQLKNALDGVKLGTQCKVIYKGFKELPAKHKFAGKPSHMVELYIKGDILDIAHDAAMDRLDDHAASVDSGLDL